MLNSLCLIADSTVDAFVGMLEDISCCVLLVIK